MFELNTREIAILLWLGGFIGFGLLKRPVRESVAKLGRAFVQRLVLIVLGLVVLYVTGCVVLLKAVGIWEWPNLKTTLLWGLTFAFVTIMDVKKLEKGPKALGSLTKDTLSATVIIVFIAEFYTFPLWGELLLVPALVMLGGMLALAPYRPEHAIVIKPLQFVQTMAGLGILSFSAYHIIQDLRGFATVGTAREFAVPILLSLMFLPFLFGLSIYMGYENAGLRLRNAIEDRGLRRYAVFRGMLAFRTNIDLYQRFVRNIQFAEELDKAAIRQAIREVRMLRRREKNPPPVPWSEGWSPYKVQALLADRDLLTNDYHRSFGDWSAESPMLDIGGGLFHDRLTYRIAGTETAATRLSLELNANIPGTPELSDAKFWEVARLLLARALGEQAAEQFIRTASQDAQGTIQADEATIMLRRDDWGTGTRGGYSRRVTIRHPAHWEEFPGLD